MGAGFSVPIGLAQSLKQQNDPRKVFGMLGDSTFFHTGINSMMDVFHAEANVCLCLLDNSITAMTGHQENAATSKNLMGYEVPPIDIIKVIHAIGFKEEQIRVVDPLDLKAMDDAVKAALAYEGPFVIVTKRPCILIKEVRKKNAGVHCEIDSAKCVGCKACMKVACPAMAFQNKKAVIADPASCTGCGLCAQMCKFGAISKVGE
jgi:indolepyruvate ferredoxin oxidoreductase alpha subunit